MIEKFEFGILGGYGRIGSEAVSRLLEKTDAKILIGGRNKKKGDVFCSDKSPRVSFQEVDILDAGSMNNFAEKCNILINCAGPGSEINGLAASAALNNKTDYIDVGGSHGLHGYLGEHKDEIVEYGLKFIVSAGMSPGLQELFISKIIEDDKSESNVLDFYFCCNEEITYTSAMDIISEIMDSKDSQPKFFNNGDVGIDMAGFEKEVLLPEPCGKVKANIYYNDDIHRTLINSFKGTGKFYSVFTGEMTKRTIFEAVMSKRLNGKKTKEDLAEKLAESSAEDMKNKEAFAMFHLEMGSSGDVETNVKKTTLLLEKVYGVSGIVAAEIAAVLHHENSVIEPGWSFSYDAVSPDKIIKQLEEDCIVRINSDF